MQTSSEIAPLALHPGNSRYFLFRGRPTVLMTSGEHYGAVLNLDFDFVRYLRELPSRGFNLTRLFSGTYREVPASFGIRENTLAPKRYVTPWQQSLDGKFDLTCWNDEYFERLRAFMTEASRYGVVVEFVFYCTIYDDDMWTVSPFNPINNVNELQILTRADVFSGANLKLVNVQKELIRKISAELREFDNLYYEIINEPYIGKIVSQSWENEMTAALVGAESELGVRHLIARNIANGAKKIETDADEISIYNFHYATPEAVELNHALNKPIADDETGFAGSDDFVYRAQAWEFMLAGGAVFSHLDYSFAVGHEDGSFALSGSPGGGGASLRKQLGGLKAFLESFDFVRMSPANHIVVGGEICAELSGTPARATAVTVRMLAEIGVAYAIYLRGGNSAQLKIDLPPANFVAEWIDTKTGAVTKSEALKPIAGLSELISPDYTEDTALRIKRAP